MSDYPNLKALTALELVLMRAELKLKAQAYRENADFLRAVEAEIARREKEGPC